MSELSPQEPPGYHQAERDVADRTAADVPAPQELRRAVEGFMLGYQFAVREITTKLEILRDDYRLVHEYNPIEHVTSRVKSLEGILAKARRKDLDFTWESIRDSIQDIAGVRVVCSFLHDIDHLREMFLSQEDVTLLEVKDYIRHPKPNGYRSLHLIVSIPVFRSSGTQVTPVELQLRTVAMDFWASLEHKIHYKFDGAVPAGLREELKEAAETSAALDQRMQRLHQSVHGGEDAEAQRRAELNLPELPSLSRLQALAQEMSSQWQA